MSTKETQEKSIGFSFTVAQAAHSLTFCLIGLLVFIFGMITGAMTQHAIALLRTMNITQASSFWSLTLGISVLGRLIAGAAADRFSLKCITITMSVLQIIGICSLRYLAQTSIFIWGFVIFYGFALGSFTSIYPLLVSKKFGLDHFSKIIGLIGLVLVLSFAAGSMTLGRMYDISGSYASSVNVLISLAVVAGIVSLFIGQPSKPKTD